MGLNRITEPTDWPVSIAEAKAFARVTTTSEDAVIGDLISGATADLERALGVSLSAQTWELSQDAFADRTVLPNGPVTAIDSFSYIDVNGTVQTVDAALYTLDDKSRDAAIVRKVGAVWPLPAELPNAVVVVYQAGTEDVDAALKQALLAQVAYAYDNRDGAHAPAFEAAINANRRILI